MGKTQSHEPKFSTEKWLEAARSDYSLREPMCNDIVAKVLSKSESDVVHLLGEPDRREITSFGLDLKAKMLIYKISDPMAVGSKPKVFEVKLSKGQVVEAAVATPPTEVK